MNAVATPSRAATKGGRVTETALHRSAESAPTESDDITAAWLCARQAQAVVYACVESYCAPEAMWALHTVMEVCVEKLGHVKDRFTDEDRQSASNLLAQAMALASLIAKEVNGDSWEILLDAGLSLMGIAKDTLDNSRDDGL